MAGAACSGPPPPSPLARRPSAAPALATWRNRRLLMRHLAEESYASPGSNIEVPDWRLTMRLFPGLLLLLLAVPAAPADAPLPDEARLRAMTARFAPVEIGADVSALPETERRALVKMIEAARVLDGLYLRQVWAGNEALLLELLADRSSLGQARLPPLLLDH